MTEGTYSQNFTLHNFIKTVSSGIINKSLSPKTFVFPICDKKKSPLLMHTDAL